MIAGPGNGRWSQKAATLQTATAKAWNADYAENAARIHADIRLLVDGFLSDEVPKVFC